MNKKISEYGIIPNSEKLQTFKIQKALDDCAEKGYMLIFECGVYKSGTLSIKSGSKIHLMKGAVISGSEDLEDYPDNEASFIDAVDQKRGKTLILINKAENIDITGEGEICGNGGSLNTPTRPFLMRIVESKNINISGISLKKAAAWCLHINNSSYVNVEGIVIDSRVNDNNDGIDIDGSNHIKIEGCHIMSGDDGICLKATSDNPCEYISIKNCKVSSGWGAFKIGTESVGDFYHIEVCDCLFYDTIGGGIKIVPTDGGNVKDLKIKNIKMDNCTGPIFITLGERLRKYAGSGRTTFSTIENVVIKNVEASVVRAPQRGIYLGEVWGNAIGGIIISGTKRNSIKNLTLENITVSLPGGVCKSPESKVKYIGKKYPEFHCMDTVPAKGIYARDVDGLILKNISLTYKESDVRNEIVLENVVNFKNCLD